MYEQKDNSTMAQLYALVSAAVIAGSSFLGRWFIGDLKAWWQAAAFIVGLALFSVVFEFFLTNHVSHRYLGSAGLGIAFMFLAVVFATTVIGCIACLLCALNQVVNWVTLIFAVAGGLLTYVFAE